MSGRSTMKHEFDCPLQCEARVGKTAMTQRILCLSIATMMIGAVACSDDDADVTDAGAGTGATTGAGHGGAGGKGGSGGAHAGSSGTGNAKAGTGGGSGSSAGSGAVGAGGTGDTGDVYKCKPPAPEPGGAKLEGEACCGGMGVCTKNPSGTGSSGYGLDACKAGSDLKCAPMVGAAADDDAGTSAIASCNAEISNLPDDMSLEGRCIPGCFTVGDPTAANLGQSSCDMGSKCVPCYSPVTGESTGACEQDGDKPTQPAPSGFPSCGDNDTGYCVPSSSVMAAGNVMLPQLTCATDQVCAPKARVLDSKACFAHCDSGIGGPGVCIASFIVPEMVRAALMKASCQDGEICVPCVSPLDQKETGACN